MQNTAFTTAWPKGVIARYLTVAGATVDLTHGTRRYPTDDGIGEDRTHTTALCSGCAAGQEFNHMRPVRGTYSTWETRDADAADQEARAWAQTHAETCRALPRPA
jgi:hypothetical protein